VTAAAAVPARAVAEAFGGVVPRDADDWPEPARLPNELPPVEPFANELLPSAWRPWIVDVSARMQCPAEFVAVPALIVLSSVVGRQLAIRPKMADDWAVVPNLWGYIVARPGLMKSPAVEEALRLLGPLEAVAREDGEVALRECEAQKLVRVAQRKQAEEDIRKAVKGGVDASGIARQAVGTAQMDEAPARRRYRTSDPTVEKLGELLRDNPRGILICRDELTGFLRSLDKDGREGDRAFYLESWAGTGSFTYDRIGRGTIEIPAACVSVLGGIQPGPLRAYLTRSTAGGAGDDGLAQRFQLAVWPDHGRTWRNIDRAPDLGARQRVADSFVRLDRIDLDAVGATRPGGDALPFLRFGDQAQGLFTEWRTELEQRLRSGDMAPAMEAHLSKFRSLIPSLALLLHLANGDTGPVTATALMQGCAWGDFLESHTRRIYGTALSPAAAGAVELSKRILSGKLPPTFAARDVYRHQWGGLTDTDTVRQSLDYLVELDWLRGSEEQTAGRSRVRYQVNPRIHAEVR